MYAYLTVKDFSVTVQDEEIQVDVNIVPFFFCSLLMLLFLFIYMLFLQNRLT